MQPVDRSHQLLANLRKTGTLTGALAKVVELRPTNAVFALDFKLSNVGAEQWEHTLDADSERHLANSERLSGTAMLLGDACPLEDLNTRLATFLNPNVNADCIANVHRTGLQASRNFVVDFVHGGHGYLGNELLPLLVGEVSVVLDFDI